MKRLVAMFAKKIFYYIKTFAFTRDLVICHFLEGSKLLCITRKLLPKNVFRRP